MENIQIFYFHLPGLELVYNRLHAGKKKCEKQGGDTERQREQEGFVRH